VTAEHVILEQDFDVGSLDMLRSAVGAHAAAAGLSGVRLYDVVSAAHELAANAVRHGAGQGQLRLWVGQGTLHCQVSDSGRIPSDGDRSVSWPARHGHGLWVVGQVADQFSIDRSAAATTATAAFSLGPGLQPAG
jgi:anti-sigma regulatory factor (Ser/Thr protein kinase)